MFQRFRTVTGPPGAKSFVLLVVAGVALRLACTRAGFNWDTQILFNISVLPFGADFYRDVPYWANWGPVAYTLFQLFRTLPGGEDLAVFHYYLATLCIACDLVSAFCIWRLWGLRASAWFLLFSPVATILSGFHCNAEPVLVAIALSGYYLHTRRTSDERAMAHPAFLACIGLSLTFKHSFVLLPLWLAMRTGAWRARLLAAALPLGIWGGSLFYYVVPDPQYWLANVVSYGGYSGNALLPQVLTWILNEVDVSKRNMAIVQRSWTPLFILLMMAVGWWTRRWKLERVVLLYPLALLVTASAVALQYFALASYSIAARVDVFGVAFSLFTAYFYAGHPDELHLFELPGWLLNRSMAVGDFNWGWLIAQTLLAAILIRRLLAWGRDERAYARAARSTPTAVQPVLE